jgi:tetratricopeptide (TPR) repeat protein
LPFLKEASGALAGNPNVWNQIGVALKNLKRFTEAHSAYLKALALSPGDTDLMLNIANNLRLAQQGDEAIAWLIQASQCAPTDLRIKQAMATVHIDQGRYPAALVLLEDLLAAGYRTVEVLCNYANALVASSRSREAIPLLQEALQQAPDFFDPNLLLANAHYALGEFDLAETLFKRAATLNPTHLTPILNQIAIQSSRGAQAEAEALCRQALALDANRPEAWAALADLKKNTSDDGGGWLQKAESLLGRKMPGRQAVALRYACGKYCDDIRNYDQAFFHYQQANQLQRSQFEPYVALEKERFVDQMIQAYSLNRCRMCHPGASDSSRPLFIVGMPRSGTSLTEQILASHPTVFGAGELDFWRETAVSHKEAFLQGELPEALLETLAADCLNYLDQCARSATEAQRVVDKMPRNFEFIGLIHAIFPNARFLHTMRNPIDTCLSIYFQYFGAAHTYANDLSDLAHCYRQYHRLMAHWRSVLPPDVLLDVPYEALVDDPEGWSRKIIDFIGLEWNDACLNFHQTERTVGTASNWQVRQPMYKTSKERWRNYEKFVGPLLPLLELYDPTKGAL